MDDMNFLDLSKVSNVRYTTLISFMNGKNKTITLNTLYDLCNGLKINLSNFFNSYLFDNIIDEHEKDDIRAGFLQPGLHARGTDLRRPG